MSSIYKAFSALDRAPLVAGARPAPLASGGAVDANRPATPLRAGPSCKALGGADRLERHMVDHGDQHRVDPWHAGLDLGTEPHCHIENSTANATELKLPRSRNIVTIRRWAIGRICAKLTSTWASRWDSARAASPSWRWFSPSAWSRQSSSARS